MKKLNRTRCSDFENKPVKDQQKISIYKTLILLGIKMPSVSMMGKGTGSTLSKFTDNTSWVGVLIC